MKSNKGFSLVELIVVIAIMAIIAGVAVPVYTTYIENAREGVDESAFNDAVYAAKLVTVDPEHADKTVTITATADEKIVISCTEDQTVAAEVAAIVGAKEVKTNNAVTGYEIDLESKAFEGTASVTNGVVAE